MFKFNLGLVLLLTGISAFGSSTGTTPCVSATLASYDSSYAPPSLGCAIGILDYSNFSYSALQNAPSASSILVTPQGNGSNGFDFSQVGGSPFTANGNIVQFAIYYNIFIDPAPVIPSASANLDPPVGNVSITEFFCNDSVLYPGTTSCFPPTAPIYSLTVTTASPNAAVTFNPPAQQFQTVGIIFTLDGTKGLASFDGLTTNTTTVITPEPASIFLVGLFLLGSGFKVVSRFRN